MKYILFLALLFSFPISLSAQNGEMRVETVYKDGSDLSAKGSEKRKYPSPDYPDDGDPANYQALIKILLPLNDAKIEKENSGIVSIEYKTGEIWVWTYNGGAQPSEIKIMHSGYHPLTINLKEHGIETKGTEVYVVKVSVPSAAITEADMFYYDLDFEQALIRYQKILNDENCSETEKDIAKIRCELLLNNNSAVIKLNKWASAQFNDYLDKESVRGRIEKIESLIKIKAVYEDLYDLTSISTVSNRIDKIDDELNNLISSVMTKGCFIVLKKKTTGVYTQHYPQKVSLYKKSSRKLFSKSNDEFLKDIYTDKGKFNCQIDGGIGYNLKFVYKDGKDVYSAERTLTFGNNYDVNGNFGNVILRLE